jgi:predicted acyl esterase
LNYQTEAFDQDFEITGPVALCLDASIDIDDTNWIADLIDVDPDGNRMLLGTGYLKAQHRAIDESKTKPYAPAHPRLEPVPVPPGEIIRYAIQLMPVSNIFQKDHKLELIIRNQDDLLSKQGIWGVVMLPFMQDVTHTIHLGESHLLLPIIPNGKK